MTDDPEASRRKVTIFQLLNESESAMLRMPIRMFDLIIAAVGLSAFAFGFALGLLLVGLR